MQTLSTVLECREQVNNWKKENLKIAFVPTMGNLHQGHLELVQKAREVADKVVVSIFVNPLQFNQASDLENYPRTMENDLKALREYSCDLVFTPNSETIYPDGLEISSKVHVPNLSEKLEGALRPNHFLGVSTVVTKLFNIVQPDFAIFGQKDFQQLAIIKKMVNDLFLSIKIIGVPTVRSKDGLALSSRNNLLTDDQKWIAPILSSIMNELAKQLPNIWQNSNEITQAIDKAKKKLEQAGFKPDAIDIVDADTLDPLNKKSKQAVILMASFLGNVRLIDNIVINLI